MPSCEKGKPARIEIRGAFIYGMMRQPSEAIGMQLPGELPRKCGLR